MSSTPQTPSQASTPDWFPAMSNISQATQVRVQLDLDHLRSPYYGSSRAARKRYAVDIVEALNETPRSGHRLMQWNDSMQERSIRRRDAHSPKHRKNKRPVESFTPRSPSPGEDDQISILMEDDGFVHMCQDFHSTSPPPPPASPAELLTPARTPANPASRPPAAPAVAELLNRVRASELEIAMLRAEVLTSNLDGNQAKIALEMSRLEHDDALRREAELRELVDAANVRFDVERGRRLAGHRAISEWLVKQAEED